MQDDAVESTAARTRICRGKACRAHDLAGARQTPARCGYDTGINLTTCVLHRGGL